MEVTPGYKQTEVGVIPEEWDVKSLGELASLYQPVTIGANEFTEAGYPVYGANGVVGFYHLSNHRTWQVTVTCRGSTCGTVNRTVDECWITGNAMVLNCDNNKSLSKDFFYFLLLGQDMSDCITGTGQPQIVRSPLAAFRVALPKALPEQRAIAAALSDVDGLLGGLDRLIAKKRDLKQAAMQQLLTGQTRLAGFASEKASFRQTEIGAFPDDWKLTRLGDLVDQSRGIRYGIVQPGNYHPQGRYMIRGQDYSEVKGWANPTDVFRVSPGIEERYRNSRVRTGDLIMTIVGYCGHVEMIPEWLNGANLTQTTARIAIRADKAVGAFCKYMLLSPTGRTQVAAYMKGAAQPGLNCGDVEKFLIPIPLLAEQTAIAEVLTEMDAELAAFEQRREKTLALKQAMMQELLTGKTRLIAAEESDG